MGPKSVNYEETLANCRLKIDKDRLSDNVENSVFQEVEPRDLKTRTVYVPWKRKMRKERVGAKWGKN